MTNRKFTHDERNYRDPFTFNPSRFLAENGNKPERSPSAYIYGYGRRICSGTILADDSVFLTCAMMLATLNISRKVDPVTKKEIIPDVEYVGNIVT